MSTVMQNIQQIKDCKIAISGAIENKGQSLSGISLSGYADKINAIQTGEQVKAGYFINTSGTITFQQISGSVRNVSETYIVDTGVAEPAYIGVSGIVFNGTHNTATKCEVIPPSFTSNITNFNFMFLNYSSMTEIPYFDCGNGINFENIFQSRSIQTIPWLDWHSCADSYNAFYNAIGLVNLGGFGGLKKSIDLHWSTLLTHDSLMNVINNLATITTTQTLTLGNINIAKLTEDEKSIATNKGWTLA